MAVLSRDLTVSTELKFHLESLATTVARPKGTVLFRRGDDVVGAFLIHSGKVSLGLDCDTSIYPTRVLGPGCVVGLPATVSGNRYSLTAKVVEDAELGLISRESVMDCLRQHPDLCFKVMDMLSGEISEIRSALKRVDLKRPAKGSP
jgi:CRP-like cAMP-binding protein